MTIIFTKQNTNYYHQNIIDLLNNVKDTVIQEAINNPKQTIKVLGDIHRSQFLADNPENFYWLRLSVHDEDGAPIIGYSGIHIFVCFRLLQFSKDKYVIGKCINPKPMSKTDIADIRGLFGFWEFRKMTTSFQINIKQNSDKIVKKREKKKLQIIDPKTGKEISF